MPIILATQEAEIRRVEVQSQPRQIVPQDPIFTKIGLVERLQVKALNLSLSIDKKEKENLEINPHSYSWLCGSSGKAPA
jgi:hypothetical protein